MQSPMRRERAVGVSPCDDAAEGSPRAVNRTKRKLSVGFNGFPPLTGSDDSSHRLSAGNFPEFGWYREILFRPG